MASSDTAKLIAALTLKDGFTGPLKNANKALGSFDAKLTNSQGRAYKAGQQIGTGIKNGARLAAAGIGIIATQVVAGLNQLAQLEVQTTATDAVLKSTKGVSGQTADSVRKLAEQYENLNAIIDDKVIQSGENVLLTFTNIRKEAFQPALEAALNLSTAMGTDLQGAIVQVGKALNDPTKGLTALRKAGVAFTDDQITQIKALQKSGDLLGAQKIILAELGTEFGGRFAAQGKTATGTIAGIGDAVEDLQKALATSLFPTIQKLLPRVRELLTSPAFTKGVSDLGAKIASLFSEENLTSGANVLKGLFQTAKDVAPTIQSMAEVTGRFVKTAVDAFKSLPPMVQGALVGGAVLNKLTGGLVTNIAGGLISAVISSFKGMMNVNAAVVNVNGGVGGLPGVLPAAGAAAGGGGILATVGALAIPVTIAAVTIAAAGTLANAIDPSALAPGTTPLSNRDPRRFDQNGIPIQNSIAMTHALVANGKAIDDVVTGLGTTESRMGKAADDLVLALGANARAVTAAFTPPDAATAHAAQVADRTARGIKDTGPSKTLTPRFAFLGASHSAGQDIAVANALAVGFERHVTPAFQSIGNLKSAIKALQADQKTFSGKNAAAIGVDIARLQAELARRVDAGAAKTTGAIVGKALSVALTNITNTFINGRILDANLERYTSTVHATHHVGGGVAR